MNGLKSNWINDKRAEEELGKFMDAYLYSKVCGVGNIRGFNRIDSRELQKLGIDVTIHTSTKDFQFDEKATLQYINKNIPTFAFELCYSGNIGWFLKDDLLTDIYCLIWPNAGTTDLHKITFSDFNKCQVMLISKKRLKEYVNKFISDIDLFNAAFAAADDNLDWSRDDKGRWHVPKNRRLYITATHHLAEKPVNLVINKDILSDICCRDMIVSKNGIEIKK